MRIFCPKCRKPIHIDWVRCVNCNTSLVNEQNRENFEYLVNGEDIITKFRAGLTCRRRLFFGFVILTNYRLIMEADEIQMNKGSKSEISKQHFIQLSLNQVRKNDTFLAKLKKQNLSESLLHREDVYQFPITGVLKKKSKKNQFIYDVILEYFIGETIKKETIKIRIQPKRVKGFSYSDYQSDCKVAFSKMNEVLEMR